MREYDPLLRALARGESPRDIAANYRRPGAGLTEILTEVTNAHTRIAGIGPQLAPLLDIPQLTDILVNNTQVWIDCGNGIEKTTIELAHEHEARQLAVHMAAACGKRLDDASPIVDGILPGGVRLHAMLPPLSSDGPLISLRIPRADGLTCELMEQQGSIHPRCARILKSLIRCRANVLISGSTGSGKTTLLGALLAWVDARERLICIEEVSELHPVHPHVVHIQERHRNVQGEGAVTLSDLVRAAMRMRPDRLILGECRGAEIRDVLAALNTGHDGGWATIHANTVHDIPARLYALGALAGMSEGAVAAQAAAAFHVVIQMRRRRNDEAGGDVRHLSGSSTQSECEHGRTLVLPQSTRGAYPPGGWVSGGEAEVPPPVPTRHYARGHYPPLRGYSPPVSETHRIVARRDHEAVPGGERSMPSWAEEGISSPVAGAPLIREGEGSFSLRNTAVDGEVRPKTEDVGALPREYLPPTRWVAQIGVVSGGGGGLRCECACEWEPGGELRTGAGWERLMRLIAGAEGDGA